MATGTKWCVAASSMYFAIFLRSAWSATVPASLVASCRCEGAKVSGQVASQTRTRPTFHGITVAPSDLFPSARQIPAGSRWATILAVARDLLMRSLIAMWRGWRPRLLWQWRPWVLLWSTPAPQRWHSCGWHRDTPKRSPMAARMHMTLSSIRSPNADTDRAWSHAPDSFLQAARRWARAGASGAAAWIALKVASTRGVSHAFWREWSAANGGGSSCPTLQALKAASRAS